MRYRQMNNVDQAAVLMFLSVLYQLRDLAELPLVMLQTVSTLIPNVFATYNQIDLRSGTLTAAYFPEEWKPRMEAIMPLMEPHVQTHPVYRHVFDSGDGRPRFISDFVGEKEWRRTPFARALAPLGVEECLIFCLQTSRQELIFIALNRASRTFTERDREVAEVLRPHFMAAYENAVAFTEVQALALLSAHAIEQTPHGIVLIDGEGQVIHMSPYAGEVLDRYFPHPFAWKTQLPPAVLQWLGRNVATPGLSTEPLQIERGGSMLTVRAAASGPSRRILHLRETESKPLAVHLRALGLTGREAEVLHWVTEGKSNPEIGTILVISSRTVAKHLQMIFAKMGVDGRVSAIIHAKGF